MNELDDEIEFVEEAKPASSDKTEFESLLYLTWDPFGDRAKIFTKDLTFKVPGKIGKIYDFASGKIMTYNKWQSICQLYHMQDDNTAPFLKWTGQDF